MSKNAASPAVAGDLLRTLAGTSATRDALVHVQSVVMLTEKGYSATGIEKGSRLRKRRRAEEVVPTTTFRAKWHWFVELIDSYAGYFSRKLDGFFLNEQHLPHSKGSEVLPTMLRPP